MQRRTLRLLVKADKVIAKTITMADAIRLEAKGLGKAFVQGGVWVWCPNDPAVKQ